MKKRVCVFVYTLFFLILVLNIKGFGEEEAKRIRLTKVKLSISANEIAREELEACLKQEFQKFPNVFLVKGGADWQLAVMAAKIPPGGDYGGDFIFATTVLKPADSTLIKSLIKDIPPQRVEPLKNYLSRLFTVESQNLNVGTTSLKQGCRTIVKDFADKYLLPWKDDLKASF